MSDVNRNRRSHGFSAGETFVARSERRADDPQSCRAPMCHGPPDRPGGPPAALCGLAQPAAAPVKDCGNGGTYTKYVYARVVNVTTRGTSCKEAKRWIRAYYRHPGKGNCIDWAEGLTNRRCFFQGFNVTNTPKRKPTYYDVRATGGVHVTIGNVIRFQLKATS